MTGRLRASSTIQRLPEQILRWSLAGLVGIGSATLALSMVGVMEPWTAWPAGIGLTVVIARILPPPGADQHQPLPGWLALLLALALVGLGWSAPYEHVLGGRDSGTYSATAAWVAENGTLRIDSGRAVFGGTTLRYGSLGFAEHSSGEVLFPQFMHFFPGLMALFAATFSLSAMFLVTPLIGGIALLAFYGLARDLMSGWLALAATFLMSITMPFLYFSRAPFSEVAAMAFFLGGLWALGRATGTGSTSHATAAGLLLGMVFVVRLDGVIVLLGLVAYLTLREILTPESVSLPLLRKAWTTAAIVSLVGVVDGLLFTPVYIANHGALISVALLGILLVRVTGTIMRTGKLQEIITENRERVAIGLTGVVLVWLVFAGLQSGSLPDAPTGMWLVWYLGAALVLLGLYGLINRLLALLKTSDLEVPGGALALIGTLGAMVYLFRPSIAPDHIWASRRFLPVVFPALVILAVWVTGRLAQRVDRWRQPLAAVVVAVMSAPILVTTLAGELRAEFGNGAEAAHQACDAVGDQAAMLFVADARDVVAGALMPLTRGWCGIPTAAEHPDSPLTTETLAILAGEVASQGRVLWIVGEVPVPGVEVTLIDADFDYLEVTVSGPPREWATINALVTAKRLDP